MARKLLFQGDNLEDLKAALARTPGDQGVITIEIDVRDAIPFFPDAHNFIVPALPGLDAGIKALPGHHLVAPSTYTVHDGIGTLHIEVRTNPIPFLLLAALVVSVLGIAAVFAFRIFKADPGEFSLILAVLLGVGILGIFLLRKYGVV